MCVTQRVGLWRSDSGSVDIGIHCAGRCPCQAARVCVYLRVSVCGHEAVDMLRWQMALLHCRASLANRGEDREEVGEEERMGCE